MLSDERKIKNREGFENLIKLATLGQPIGRVDLSYSIIGVQPIAGLWYFAAGCPSCKGVTTLFRDTSCGKLGRPFYGPGTIDLTCQHCPQLIVAAPQNISPVFWP